jgi:hypothetical protein
MSLKSQNVSIKFSQAHARQNKSVSGLHGSLRPFGWPSGSFESSLALSHRSLIFLSVFLLLSFKKRNISRVFHLKLIESFLFEIYPLTFLPKSCMPFLESMGPFFRFDWEKKTRIHGEQPLSSMRYVFTATISFIVRVSCTSLLKMARRFV